MANDPNSMIKAPAIALLISGILSGSAAVLSLVGGAVRLVDGINEMPSNENERLGFVIATVGTYGIAVITLVASPLVILGASKMLGGNSMRLSRDAAILSVIPFTACCFLIGIPAGIWALIVLGRPEVKALFAGEYAFNAVPPAPPQF